MELNGERVTYTPSEAMWLQHACLSRRDGVLADVAQRLLDARYALAATFISPQMRPPCTTREAMTDHMANLRLYGALLPVQRFEADYGSSPDGTELHVIETTITPAEKPLLLALARTDYAAAKAMAGSINEVSDAVETEMPIRFADLEAHGMDNEEVEALRESLSDPALAAQVSEQEFTSAMQTISATAGIIRALEADLAPGA